MKTVGSGRPSAASAAEAASCRSPLTRTSEQAGAGGTGPEAGRVARSGDHHDAVHETRHVGLDAHVREGDQVVVPVVPVPRRSDSDGPTVPAFQRVALELGARRTAGGDLLQGVADQGEEVEIGQSARAGLGAAQVAAYPGHAEDHTEACPWTTYISVVREWWPRRGAGAGPAAPSRR